jgi:hypothetical protein
MTKINTIEYDEYKEVHPKYFRYLPQIMDKYASKLFTTLCNRGLYHYENDIRKVEIEIDLNPKKIHCIRTRIQIGKNVYQKETDIHPPFVPWFDDLDQKL